MELKRCARNAEAMRNKNCHPAEGWEEVGKLVPRGLEKGLHGPGHRLLRSGCCQLVLAMPRQTGGCN